jgi:glyoxylase-like metal-dependent hydrolase (beta-lactamase superfamily II)
MMMERTDRLPVETADFLRRTFGPFEFGGIEVPPPTRTFTGFDMIDVGGRPVDLIEVGPAHTAGDVIAWIPDAQVVFTGDILFIDGTPIVWAGPVANWIAACEKIVALDASVIVPGHGPLTDAEGVRAVGAYLRTVEEGARVRHAAGMTSSEATWDLHDELSGTPFGAWGDRERLVINVETIWTTLEPAYVRPSFQELFGRMAHLAGSMSAS